MGLHTADYAVLAIYFVTIILIGINEARKIKSSGDYFMPRKFGKILMTFFAFGAGTHSDQAVTVAAKSYTSGLSGIWYQWLWLPVTPFYWLMAPIMRRFRAITTSDVFELRYDRSVSMLYAVMGTANLIISLGLMIKASSEVISASTGSLVSPGITIAIMTFLFLAYGVCGGLSAAVITDFLQGILTIAFSFMLLPVVMNAIGGMGGLRQSLSTEMMSMVAPKEISTFYIAAIAINGLIGIITHAQMMGNCGAGKTEFESRFGLVAGNFLKRFCTIPWAFIGLAGIVYLSNRNVGPDQVFGTVAHDFLSKFMPGLLGIFIAAVMASVMSTCDVLMIASSALLTENLYKPMNPNKSSSHYVTVGRVNCAIVVAMALVFAYWVPGLVKGLEIYWKVTSMMGMAFWLGLFWYRTTTAGAWASTLATLGMWLLTTKSFFIEFMANLPGSQTLRFVIESETGLQFYLPWQMIFYLSSGLIAGIIVSLFTKPVSAEKLERYYALVRTPIKPGEVVEKTCHVPEGTPIPPRRNIFSNTSIEVMVPSRQSVVGFIISWVLVGLIIMSFYAIVKM